MSMRFARFPEGFVEIDAHNVTITGGDPMIIPRSSVRAVVCRDGKKSIFSRAPPAVLEIEYAAGIGTNRMKLLLVPEERARLDEALKSMGMA